MSLCSGFFALSLIEMFKKIGYLDTFLSLHALCVFHVFLGSMPTVQFGLHVNFTFTRFGVFLYRPEARYRSVTARRSAGLIDFLIIVSLRRINGSTSSKSSQKLSCVIRTNCLCALGSCTISSRRRQPYAPNLSLCATQSLIQHRLFVLLSSRTTAAAAIAISSSSESLSLESERNSQPVAIFARIRGAITSVLYSKRHVFAACVLSITRRHCQ